MADENRNGRRSITNGVGWQVVAKAIGYIRVSTEEQVAEGFSLHAQRARIEGYYTARVLG